MRARAATQYTLKLTGIVNTVDATKSTVSLTGVQFAAGSRQGTVRDLGDWIITAPAQFNFASLSPGMSVTVGVEATTFNITDHAVSAITLTPGK